MAVDPSAVRTLAAYLTAQEAKQLADRLDCGGTATQAMGVVGSTRRADVVRLLADAGLGVANRVETVAVLRSVEGAHAHQTSIMPVWTAPANLVRSGGLTASIEHFVRSARESVICSTYNFQRSSVLWKSLADLASRPEVGVRVYVDTDAADKKRESWKPTTAQIAHELSGAIVFRTAIVDSKRVRNHAKFIAVDHQFLVVTSANFSKSAELFNVELGLRIENPRLTQSVERQMRELEDHVYERLYP